MEETLQYLYSLKNQGSKLGLERIDLLLKKLGNPEKSFKSILVGGTNGKGSTVAMIYSILREAGYKVGRYTSPHLVNLNERIVVNEQEIEDEDIIRIVNSIRRIIEKEKIEITFFELMTAVAFAYYKEKKVEFAVLEVGLGGRLDATNIVTPLVSVITNISLEHMDILGSSIEKIAFEKGGIIKENGILITGAGDGLGTLREICQQRKSGIIIVGKDIVAEDYNVETNQVDILIFNKKQHIKIGLKGQHQVKNACCAFGVAETLRTKGVRITDQAILDGFEKVVWPGRFEIIQKQPTVILDCAKDAEAAKSLGKLITELKFKKIILVIGISSDKNIKAMVSALSPLAKKVIITKHKIGNRAADPREIVKYVKQENEIIDDVKEAVKKAIKTADNDEIILVTGSVFTVGEAREIWFNKKTIMGPEFNDRTNIKL